MECVALDVERLHLRQNKIFDLAMAARLPLEILVAEDNLVNQKAAVAVLRQFGYQTDLVISGKEAVEAVERQKYDVLFMDLQMPDIEGVEAIRLICSRMSSSERPYIVAMTANAMKEDASVAFLRGWMTISAS